MTIPGSVVHELEREVKIIDRLIDDKMIYAKGGDQLHLLKQLLQQAGLRVKALEAENQQLARMIPRNTRKCTGR